MSDMGRFLEAMFLMRGVRRELGKELTGTCVYGFLTMSLSCTFHRVVEYPFLTSQLPP
jgi:hypothetical protein